GDDGREHLTVSARDVTGKSVEAEYIFTGGAEVFTYAAQVGATRVEHTGPEVHLSPTLFDHRIVLDAVRAAVTHDNLDALGPSAARDAIYCDALPVLTRDGSALLDYAARGGYVRDYRVGRVPDPFAPGKTIWSVVETR